MTIRKPMKSFAVAAASFALLSNAAPGEPASQISAGAARVLITPAAADLPAHYKKVADDIYLRAILIESAGKRAAIVIIDAPTIGAATHAELKTLIAQTAKVPLDNILLGTTHTHNSIRIDPTVEGILLPGSPRFVEQVKVATRKAIVEAAAAMRPARVGTGRGKAYLVTARNQWSYALSRYIEGTDRSGNQPVDHGVGVFKIEDMHGKPIAYVVNYALNPVIAMALEGEISGDVPGRTARYVEKRLKDEAVVLFTVSSASAPLYRDNRDAQPDSIYGAPDARDLLHAMGTILGEEIIETSKEIEASGAVLPILGASKALVCPGKVTRPLNLPNRCAHSPGSTLPACEFKDSDAPPVTLNMGYLRLGDLAMMQTDANVTAPLAQKYRQAAPLSNSWIVALTYGPMHYVMDDASYVQNTYEATASTAKPGCAERGFLDGARELASRAR